MEELSTLAGVLAVRNRDLREAFASEKNGELMANDLAAEPAGDLSGLSPEDIVSRIEQILKRRREGQQ